MRMLRSVFLLRVSASSVKNRPAHRRSSRAAFAGKKAGRGDEAEGAEDGRPS